MKSTKTKIINQDNSAKTSKSLERIKLQLKHRTNQLASITDNDTIVFYLREIEKMNYQRISLEKQLGGSL